MAVTNPVTTNGSLVYVSAATPATFDAAGFGALTWTLVPDMISWPEIGDDHATQSYGSLRDGTIYVQGARDGGNRSFSMRYEKTDAGQIIIRAANGGSPMSVKVVDTDGETRYLWGIVNSLKMVPVDGSTVKGQSGQFAANRAPVVV